MKIEHRNESFPGASLSPIKDPVASFRHMLKNLWLAHLLPQIVFHAASSGVIALVLAISRTVQVSLASISGCLHADVSIDSLNKRFVLRGSNALQATAMRLIVTALLCTVLLFDVCDLAGDPVLSARRGIARASALGHAPYDRAFWSWECIFPLVLWTGKSTPLIRSSRFFSLPTSSVRDFF
jgi:hypothetical protein